MNKIDFTVIFGVEPGTNPNGDPLDGNRPRQLLDGRGEVSDVCIKHKLRNRLSALGNNVLIKSTEDCKAAGEPSTVLDRYTAAVNGGDEIKELTSELIDKGLDEFVDIRMFGQVYTFLKNTSGEHTTGAVSIRSATSVDPIVIKETQITKSISNNAKDGVKGSDTMGMKNSLESYALYVFSGSISPRTANKNHMSDEDVQLFKKALCSLFQDDVSTARPAGSMNIERVLWYEHSSLDGDVHPSIVKDALKILLKEGVETPRSFDDYEIVIDDVEGLPCEDIVRPWNY